MTIELNSENRHKSMMRFFLIFVVVLIGLAFASAKPEDLLHGFVKLNVEPSHLISDFVAIGGFGATLLNVALVTLFELGIIFFSKEKLTGTKMAGMLTVAGFSFFGTSLFNTIPIFLGVLAYCRIEKIPFHNLFLQASMATAIGPLVNFLASGLGLQPIVAYPLAFLAGLLIGLVIIPLSKSFINFHQGYNLYNIGFTAGIIGLIAASLLRLNGINIQPMSVLDTQHRSQLILLSALFSFSLIVFGLILAKWNLRKYAELLKGSGRLLSDFVELYGDGITLFNMGLMGLLSLAWILVLKAPVNGPVVGAIFTIIGFAALGKHPRNSIPVMLGATIACFFHGDLRSTGAIVPILFGTTLAPLAGGFGPIVGLVAGYLHIAVVSNVLALHGGLDLYNNGFSGGFVAAFLVPVVEAIRKAVELRKAN